MARRPPGMSHTGHASTSVSTIELFFDLVFVFTITQVTNLVVEEPTPVGIARAVLITALIWWIYDGYAWLTNHVAPDQTIYRLLMIASMGGFLVLALAVPHAFGRDGIAFGAAYLVVTVVHSALFTQASEGWIRGMLLVTPVNIVGALAVLAAGWLHGAWDWIIFSVVIAAYLVVLLRPKQGFTISARHFVERHGLLMIIAFGESVVAVGIGAAGLDVRFDLVVGASLALIVVTGMWWCYFAADDARAEHAMAGFGSTRAARVAGTAFGIMHPVMIFGVILFSAGVKKSIAHVFAPPHEPGAWLLAAGVAVFLLGDAAYRRILEIGTPVPRVVVAALATATAVAGVTTSAAIQLALLGLLLAGVVAADRRGS